MTGRRFLKVIHGAYARDTNIICWEDAPVTTNAYIKVGWNFNPENLQNDDFQVQPYLL